MERITIVTTITIRAQSKSNTTAQTRKTRLKIVKSDKYYKKMIAGAGEFGFHESNEEKLL